MGDLTNGITDHFVSYIKPKKEVMWQASRVHQITTEDLQDAPPYLTLWPEIKVRLSERVLVAHSCGTEKRFLRTFPGHKFTTWVDSLTLSKASLPDLESHKLGALLPYLGNEFEELELLQGRKWHDALYDAAASFYFVKTLVEQLRLQDSPMSLLLHPNTQTYHALRHR